MGLLEQTQRRRQLYTFVHEDQDIPFYCEQSVNCLQIMNERHHANQTLLLQSTETVVPSLNRLRCALEADLAASVGINVYWSPPNSVGFKLHHDGHDIIVSKLLVKNAGLSAKKKESRNFICTIIPLRYQHERYEFGSK